MGVSFGLVTREDEEAAVLSFYREDPDLKIRVKNKVKFPEKYTNLSLRQRTIVTEACT
jgi:hypothetical protein